MSEPELGPPTGTGLFSEGFRFLAWLYVRPSRWAELVRSRRPGLRRDFTLLELTVADWRGNGLGRSVVKLHCAVAMVTVIIGTAGLLALSSLPPSLAVTAAAYGTVLCMAGTLVVGILIGVAPAVAGAPLIGVAFAANFGSETRSWDDVIARARALAESPIAASLGLDGAVTDQPSPIVGALVSVAIGCAGSFSGLFAGAASSSSALRQIGGFFAGVFLSIGGCAAIVAAGGLFGRAENSVTLILVTAMAGGVAGRLRLVGWRGAGAGLTVAGVLLALALLPSRSGLAGAASTLLRSGIARAAFFSVFFSLAFLLAARWGGPWAGGAASALGSGSAFVLLQNLHDPLRLAPALAFSSVFMLVGLALHWWQPVLMYPFEAAWNTFVFHADRRRREDAGLLLTRNAAFWDEHQRIRLPVLEDHLILALERQRAGTEQIVAGASAMPVRVALRAARLEMDARALEQCEDMGEIAGAYSRIGGAAADDPGSAVLRRFASVSRDVRTAQQHQSGWTERAALTAVDRRLDELTRDLQRSPVPLAARVCPIAGKWQRLVAERMVELERDLEARQEIPNPYVVGLPLTQEQEVFVGRAEISARIGQIALSETNTPLLLYGQRRMGKTSLLNNFGRLLPSHIVPLFADLQGPASAASDIVGFLHAICRQMRESALRLRGLSIPEIHREELSHEATDRFSEWLASVESALGGRTVLLALDEFEALDMAFDRGRLARPEVLGLLRHIIQHRHALRVLLAGSHTLDEIREWSSYLVNVLPIKIEYLAGAEAQQLIEAPVRSFPLVYETEASERVREWTRCHPYLVQLLCHYVVAEKNAQPLGERRTVTVRDVDRSVPAALMAGTFFFQDIEVQAGPAGTRLLRSLAADARTARAGRHGVPGTPDSEVVERLFRRELLEDSADGGLGFAVPLVRRWFQTGAEARQQ